MGGGGGGAHAGYPINSDIAMLQQRCYGRQLGWPGHKEAILQQATQELTGGAQCVGQSDAGLHQQRNVSPVGIHEGDMAGYHSDLVSSEHTVYSHDQTPIAGPPENRIIHPMGGILPGNVTGASALTEGHVGTANEDFTAAEIVKLHRLDTSQAQQGDGESGAVDTGQASSNVALYKTFSDLDASQVNANNGMLMGIFDKVAAHGCFNYMGARIRLPSGLEIEGWRTWLRGYHDYRIIEFLEFGWPIGIDRGTELQPYHKNHTSALAHPADIEHYIFTELGHLALLGPFDGLPPWAVITARS